MKHKSNIPSLVGRVGRDGRRARINAGCSKDFLDRDPYIGSSAGNFYQTADDAEAATIACYAPLQVEISDGAHFRWYFGDIVSDDADKGGSGDTDEPDLLEFENFFGDPSSGIVLGEWKTAYKGITYCNIALQNIPGIEMDEFQKLAYLGEAKFLRAYWYFNLVTTFGGVPLVTAPLAPSEYAQPRATAEEVWAQIVADLEDAAANLPEKSAYSTSADGRATRGAANALLAKAHLYQGKWSECRVRCEEVVGSGEYFLDPTTAASSRKLVKTVLAASGKFSTPTTPVETGAPNFGAKAPTPTCSSVPVAPSQAMASTCPPRTSWMNSKCGKCSKEKTCPNWWILAWGTLYTNWATTRLIGGNSRKTPQACRASISSEVLQPCGRIGALRRPQPQRRVQRPCDSLGGRVVDACGIVQPTR